MADKRKQYQRDWVQRKRTRERAKKKQELDLFLSNSDSSPEYCSNCHPSASSDNDNCAQNQSSHVLSSFNMGTPSETINTDLSDNTDDSDSPSDCDCFEWDDIDIDAACDKFSDSSDDNNDGELNIKTFSEKLKTWAVETNVTHNQLNKLLPILNQFDATLPLTAKTLLKTGDCISAVNVCSLSGGDYIFFGFKDGLDYALKCSNVMESIDAVELTLNIDGLPLFHSSTYSLWPILCCVSNVRPAYVYPVALYGGKTKPSNLDFLHDSIRELHQLLVNGFSCGEKNIACKFKFCICDAPARAMVKCVKQFSGYYGCDKCTQKGSTRPRMYHSNSCASFSVIIVFHCDIIFFIISCVVFIPDTSCVTSHAIHARLGQLR